MGKNIFHTAVLKIKKYNRYQIACCLTLILLLFCIVIQLFFTPYYGLADNGDYLRLSKKTGIDRIPGYHAEGHYDDQFWGYFLNEFDYKEPVDLGFYSSSEHLVSMSKFINDIFVVKSGRYDIRSFGFVLFLIYAAGLIVLYKIYANLPFQKWLWLLPAASFIFFADVSNLMYFNTFYSEATGLVFMLLFFAMAWMWIRKKQTLNLLAKAMILLVEIISAYFCSAAKVQYFLCLIAFVFVLTLQLIELFKEYSNTLKSSLARFGGCIVSVLSILCLVVFVGNSFIYNTSGVAGYVTTANIIQKDILGYATQPEELLRKTGFEENVIPEIMKTAGRLGIYEGVTAANIEHLYRTEGTLYNRSTELKMFMIEPHIVWDLLVNNSKALFSDAIYGTKMKEYGDIPASQEIGFRLFKNIKDKTIQITSEFHFYIFAIVMVGSSLLYAYQIMRQKKILTLSWQHLALALNMCCALCYVTSIFGESSHVLSKYFFLVNQMFYIIAFVFLVNCCKSICGSISSGKK